MMTTATRERVAITCAMLGAFLFVTASPSHAASNLKGSGIPGKIGVEPNLGTNIPLDLTFRDEAGKEVKLRQFFGQQPVLLNLVYYGCPMLCRMTSDGLLRTLKTMDFEPGREFLVLTISFDPREGPELARSARETMLARYGRPNASAGWRFLTGDKPQIEALTNAVGFQYYFDEERGQYAHAAGLFVVTPEGQLSRFLSGVEFSARDLRLAVVEGSRNEVGSMTDQVLLLCYQYDPSKGKYGLAILSVVRVSGVLTVLAMVAGFVALRRREHSRGADKANSNSTQETG